MGDVGQSIEGQTGIMSCGPQERIFLLEVLEFLDSRRSPEHIETNIAVSLIECQIKKYSVHGVEVSEDARWDELCHSQPDFWRNSWDHGGEKKRNV